MTKKHSKIVKTQFDTEYETYDQEIRDVFPFYEKMHKKVTSAVDFQNNSELTILDLGIGTGQTTLDLLIKFPNAKITGVDVSPKMFGVAKNRLRELAKQVKFIEADMIDFKPTQKFDVCIAVLSIHHLNQREKQKLFDEDLQKRGYTRFNK